MNLNFNLLIFKFTELPRVQLSLIVPTACLLVADEVPSAPIINDLVTALVSSGCSHFMTWGRAADALHDALDSVLESGEKDGFINVVTTSHGNETIEDIAWFLVNAALPGEEIMRCCVGFESEINTFPELLECVSDAIKDK